MDNFEFTKIAGAVLSALLLIFGFKTIIEMNVGHGHGPEKAGYTLPVTEANAATAPAGEEGAAAAGGGESILALLPKANADNGKSVFNKCKACHTTENGKPNGVGPNLWGIVNRPKGSHEGFSYSDAMQKKGGNWTFEDLSEFLRRPKSFVPGTKMVFNGIPSPSDEADLIAYLATLADTPVPLPK
jgi:cytochrome c